MIPTTFNDKLSQVLTEFSVPEIDSALEKFKDVSQSQDQLYIQSLQELQNAISTYLSRHEPETSQANPQLNVPEYAVEVPLGLGDPAAADTIAKLLQQACCV